MKGKVKLRKWKCKKIEESDKINKKLTLTGNDSESKFYQITSHKWSVSKCFHEILVTDGIFFSCVHEMSWYVDHFSLFLLFLSNSGGVGGCDGSKSCESMPLSDWDSTIKRSSLRGSTIDEPGMGFFTPSGTTNNNLKLNRCSNTNGNSVPGNDVSVGTNNSGAKVNESIYFPSPYALSRISAYERSLSSSAGNEPRTPHSIIVNGTGSHTYDVPLKKVQHFFRQHLRY